MKNVTVTRGSGNIWRDLGFSKEEAEKMTTKARLTLEITKVIEERWNRGEAAAALGLTEPELDILLSGRGLRTITVERLNEHLSRLSRLRCCGVEGSDSRHSRQGESRVKITR